MKPLTVLSLFDGMSCARQALERVGIPIKTYYASEIDKFAIKVTMANYQDTIQLGSVVDVDVFLLPEIPDLICAGSPCQSFSFAGKRKGMATKCEQEILTLDKYLELKQEGFQFEGQSYLFWEFMRILTDVRKLNPDVKFLLENVLMGEKWEKVLTGAVGVNPIEINSALVSAQNRRRLYWTNLGMQPAGLFGDMESIIQQPKDRGLLLKDILETNADNKYYLSDKMRNYLNTRKDNYNSGKINYKTGYDVASCINASSGHIDISDNIIVDINMPGRVDEKYYYTQKAIDYINRDPRNLAFRMDEKDEKSKCITAVFAKQIPYNQLVERDNLIVAMRGRNPENPKSCQSGLPTEQQLEPRKDGKTNCLTSVQKDNLVMQINPSKESNGCQPSQQNRVYDPEGISPSLMAQMSSGTHAIIIPTTPIQVWQLDTAYESNGRVYSTEGKSKTINAGNGGGGEAGQRTGLYLHEYRIRRLTPVECERLQTVKDCFTKFGAENKKIIECGNALLTTASQISQVKKLNYATSITYGSLEAAQLNQGEELLLTEHGVVWKTVKDHKNPLTVFVLCTIKDLLGLEQQIFRLENLKEIKNVRVAIRKLGKTDLMDSVPSIVKCKDSIIIRYMLKRDEQDQSLMDTYEILVELECTELLCQSILAVDWDNLKRFTILTWIEQITNCLIYTYASQSRSIEIYISDLTPYLNKGFQGKVSYLKTENISIISDSARYKMLGNGWTIEVIAHILSYLK